MRWFRLGQGKRQVERDPGRQETLLKEIQQQYGAHVRVPFPDQVDALTRLLGGDDGLVAAAGVLGLFADAAYTDLLAQASDLHRRTGHGFAVDRRDYRPLWQAAGAELRWPLFSLPPGLHPYVQVSAAVAVIGGQARRSVKVTDPEPLLAHLFEVYDLTLAGWEFARVRVDTDAATLAGRLVTAARELRAVMPDPPPLPPPVRELMRRNRTVDVYEAAGDRVVGVLNPGRELRESLLV